MGAAVTTAAQEEAEEAEAPEAAGYEACTDVARLSSDQPWSLSASLKTSFTTISFLSRRADEEVAYRLSQTTSFSAAP